VWHQTQPRQRRLRLSQLLKWTRSRFLRQRKLLWCIKTTLDSSYSACEPFNVDVNTIQEVAEAILTGSQILNEPLQSGPPGTFGAVPPFLLGNIPTAMRQKANDTGANPWLYGVAWHMAYAKYVVKMLHKQDRIDEFFRLWIADRCYIEWIRKGCDGPKRGQL